MVCGSYHVFSRQSNNSISMKGSRGIWQDPLLRNDMLLFKKRPGHHEQDLEYEGFYENASMACAFSFFEKISF